MAKSSTVEAELRKRYHKDQYNLTLQKRKRRKQFGVKRNQNVKKTQNRRKQFGVNYNQNVKKTQNIERTGYIYCIVDRNNVAKYIGQTVRNPVTRFNEHLNGAFDPTSSSYNTQFSQAIRTYGINNFSLLILESEIPESNLDSKEKAYIAHYNTFHGGYNGTRGGGRVKTQQMINYIPPKKYTSHNTHNQKPETYTTSSNNSSKDYDSSDYKDTCMICCIFPFIIIIILSILGSILSGI
jgi:hypothetical protein